MIKLDVDGKQVLRRIKKYHKDQAPYATKVAINALAVRAAQRISRDAHRFFDRPTPFTTRAYTKGSKRFNGRYATKTRPIAEIIPKPIQAKYLEKQVLGGTSNRRKAIPARGYPTNQYGNLPRSETKKKGVFFIRGKGGMPIAIKFIKKRGEGVVGSRAVAVFPSRRTYRRRYPIHDIAARTVQWFLTLEFRKAFERAHTTMR